MPPGDPVVATRDLTKKFGKLIALDRLTMSVERGQILGFIGPNGAGKTTAIKILVGLARPTSGSATVAGTDCVTNPRKIRRLVGYMPDIFGVYDNMRVGEYLDFFGAAFGIRRRERVRRIDEVLETAGAAAFKDLYVETLSHGMKQRVAVARTLLHDPAVIFLDEPTDGVDPVGRREIRAIMQRLKERGKTIFLNSHLLGEVELVCDRVGILSRGEMIREGDIATLTKQKGHFQIGLAEGQTLPTADLEQRGYSVRRDGLFWEIGVQDGQTIDPVVDLLRDRKLSLRHLIEKRQSLEDMFMETVEAAEPGIDAPVPRRDRPPARARERRAER